MVWDDVGRKSMIIAHMIHWVNFAKYTVRLSDILLFGSVSGIYTFVPDEQ